MITLADRRPHGKGTLIINRLFTSFAHFEANVPILSADSGSHDKGTLCTTVLFSCRSHLEADIGTRSADTRSYGKRTFIIKRLLTSMLISKQTLRVCQGTQGHMGKEQYRAHPCSPVLLTSNHSLRPGQLMEDQMGRNAI